MRWKRELAVHNPVVPLGTTQIFYVLPTEHSYVLVIDLRTKSEDSTVRHKLMSVVTGGGRSGNGIGYSPSTSVFPLLVSFHQCSIFVCINLYNKGKGAEVYLDTNLCSQMPLCLQTVS